MTAKDAISLLKETASKWSAHQAPRLGASVAFYSVLSFAPLLILLVTVAGLVFDPQTTQRTLIDQARMTIGDRGADTVQALLSSAHKPASGLVASVIAFITLLFGASGVFGELRDALNTIWETSPKSQGGIRGLLKERLFTFGMVLSVGFLLLVFLIISAALAFIGKYFGQLIPVPEPVLHAFNFVFSLAVITVLFALMFKFVPAARISWRDVIVGAIGTALLFTIGKFLLALYLGKAGVGSAYGAAGSLVAVIVWVYYSAQIFFFGAEFTHVYALHHQPPEAKAAGNRAA
jgi:membrane protein